MAYASNTYKSWEEEVAAQQAEIQRLREMNMARRESSSVDTPIDAATLQANQLSNIGAFDVSKVGQSGARGPLGYMGGKWGYYSWDANGQPSWVAINPANRAEEDAFIAQSNYEQGSVPVYDPATGQSRGTNASLGFSNQSPVMAGSSQYLPYGSPLLKAPVNQPQMNGQLGTSGQAPAGSPFDYNNWLGSGKPIDPQALGKPAGAAGQPGYVWSNPANVALQEKWNADYAAGKIPQTVDGMNMIPFRMGGGAQTQQQGPSSIPPQQGMLNQSQFQWNGAPQTQTAPKQQGASFNPYMNNFFTSYWGK